MGDALSGLALITATTTAWWAAFAAVFAALSAFLTFLAQRRQLLESIRPELVLLYWGRPEIGRRDSPDVVTFAAIKNIGRGTAVHIRLHVSEVVDNRPTVVMSTTRVQILGVGDEEMIDGRISVWFKNVPPLSGTDFKAAHAPVSVLYLDSRGNIFETIYNLTVVQDTNTLTADQIAPGVAVHRVTRMVRPLWRVRVLRAIRWPGRAVRRLRSRARRRTL